MSIELNITPSTEQLPAPLFTPTPPAARRMLEFFTAQLNNPHTRRAYLNATRRFAITFTKRLTSTRSSSSSSCVMRRE